ncbi:MAG: hypothetical protein ACI8X5_001433 [Planctomycetota bacterium]|jgi:hypothetical protein
MKALDFIRQPRQDFHIMIAGDSDNFDRLSRKTFNAFVQRPIGFHETVARLDNISGQKHGVNATLDCALDDLTPSRPRIKARWIDSIYGKEVLRQAAGPPTKVHVTDTKQICLHELDRFA